MSERSAAGAGGGGPETPRRWRTIPVGGQVGRSGEPVPVVNIYDALGGQPFFDELVERFYRGVVADPLLRPLYPDDLTESKRHLALFLGQYWGGPTTYSDERGHPRLRMRHVPFVIAEPERDAWLRHMAAALDSLVVERDIHPALEARLLDYFAMAADGMINAR
ncbi:MAG TPA: globin [Acidimicrobiales bacterium]|nr:globin [Acidimicrobiales bacterium]